MKRGFYPRDGNPFEPNYERKGEIAMGNEMPLTVKPVEDYTGLGSQNDEEDSSKEVVEAINDVFRPIHEVVATYHLSDNALNTLLVSRLDTKRPLFRNHTTPNQGVIIRNIIEDLAYTNIPLYKISDRYNISIALVRHIYHKRRYQEWSQDMKFVERNPGSYAKIEEEPEAIVVPENILDSMPNVISNLDDIFAEFNLTENDSIDQVHQGVEDSTMSYLKNYARAIKTINIEEEEDDRVESYDSDVLIKIDKSLRKIYKELRSMRKALEKLPKEKVKIVKKK